MITFVLFTMKNGQLAQAMAIAEKNGGIFASMKLQDGGYLAEFCFAMEQDYSSFAESVYKRKLGIESPELVGEPEEYVF